MIPPHLQDLPPPPPAATTAYSGTLTLLGVALALDLAAGTVMFAILGGLVCIPLGLYRLARSTRHTRRRASLALGLAILAPVVAVGAVVLNASHARAVRGDVVAAVESFHAREGHWPRELADLIPRDLQRFPRAKYTLAFGGFDYYAMPEGAAPSTSPSTSSSITPSAGPDQPPRGPILFYVVYPPFMRSSYSFDDRSWKTID